MCAYTCIYENNSNNNNNNNNDVIHFSQLSNCQMYLSMLSRLSPWPNKIHGTCGRCSFRASTSSAMHQIRVSNEKSGSMATTCSSLTSANKNVVAVLEIHTLFCMYVFICLLVYLSIYLFFIIYSFIFDLFTVYLSIYLCMCLYLLIIYCTCM